MKERINNLTDDNLDLEDLQVEWAAQKAAIEAMHRARQAGTDYVIWEDDKVKSLKPNETAPYEQIALENLKRLENRIRQLEEQPEDANALVLKDKPKP